MGQVEKINDSSASDYDPDLRDLDKKFTDEKKKEELSETPNKQVKNTFAFKKSKTIMKKNNNLFDLKTDTQPVGLKSQLN